MKETVTKGLLEIKKQKWMHIRGEGCEGTKPLKITMLLV